MTHIDFVILNSHVTVIYLRFIKSTSFFFFFFTFCVVKQKKLKYLYFSLLFILVYKMCLFKTRKLLVK